MSILHYASKFRRQFRELPSVHNVVARGDNAELCYVPGAQMNTDARYWLVRDDGAFAVFGETGLVETISMPDGEHQNSGRRIIAHRPNAYGFPNMGDPAVQQAIDTVYATIQSLDFVRPSFRGTNEAPLESRFGWDSARLRRRFKKYAETFRHNGIIPEYTDLMTIVEVSSGCGYACRQCPYSKQELELFSESQIKANMQLGKALQEEFHEPAAELMTELYFCSSDFLWPHILGEGVDPVRTVELSQKYFPHVLKRYAFMGVPNILQADEEYLASLLQVGLNRVIVGADAYEDATLKFLGKPYNRKDVAEAYKKLNKAGFKKTKQVLLVLPAERIVAPDRGWVDTRELLAESVSRLATATGAHPSGVNREKILISRCLPLPGTELMHRLGNGQAIPDNARHQEDTIRWLVNELWDKGFEPELGYENAVHPDLQAA